MFGIKLKKSRHCLFFYVFLIPNAVCHNISGLFRKSLVHSTDFDAHLSETITERDKCNRKMILDRDRCSHGNLTSLTDASHKPSKTVIVVFLRLLQSMTDVTIGMSAATETL